MKEKMWAYLMHLGDNMWGDPGSTLKFARYESELQTDDKVWKDTIDFLPSQGINTVLIDIGDAIQYETHPEISVKGAWSKDKLKAELDRMRAMGLTPLPKLNFSAGHDAWLGEYSRMLSTTPYYQVCKDLILEVAELFGNPEYFHLGMDEEDPKNQGALAFCCIRQHDLWWHDLYYLFDVCDKAGVRPWVWSDYSWHKPEKFIEKMPKSALQSNFWYNTIRKKSDGVTYREPMYDAYRILAEAGYDQVPCVSFFEGYSLNAEETMRLGKEEIASDNLVGYMTAPWRNPLPINKYSLLDDAYRFGQAKKKEYPEECK